MSLSNQKTSPLSLGLNQSSEINLLDLPSSSTLNLNSVNFNLDNLPVNDKQAVKNEMDLAQEISHKTRVKDNHCWLCHKEKSNISCKLCPRSFHLKCLPDDYIYFGQEMIQKTDTNKSSSWICIECTTIMKSDNLKTRSATLNQLNPQEFSQLLTYALQTIKAVS